ncbi:proline iminopeptidase-family hydrolase [Gimibacter soli]|uniref:Proline iminopeptidase-family hydrolase n=1 Tax=Gimibacter soli TaxID=3024400 RepID=A0AAF0BHG6_9PROT|nr:proline iminopeptidase-family hydrolase [Gimibacter soli]WCL54253.1 proline iminopeptidase-family hydrolase [Gimibacter soli]
MSKFIKAFIGALVLALSFSAAPVLAHTDPEVAGYIPVDGGRVWYRLNGARHLGKKPAIIVMHGGPGGTHRSNMPYVKLSDTYPVILYDQLDTGNSDRPGDRRKWTVEHFVSEIDAIRRALDLKEVIIAGHSWGGTLAAEYAVRNPKGLKAAILSSPLLNTRQWIADNREWIEAMPEKERTAIITHEEAGTTNHPDYRAAEDAFYARHMCRKSPCPNADDRTGGPEKNNDVYEYMWGPTEFFAPGTLRDYDVTARLDAIQVPTLVICGEFDEAAPKSCRKYTGMIKGGDYHTIPDAGHSTMRENEALYLETVRAFLAGVRD